MVRKEVCGTDDVPAGGMRRFEVDGKAVLMLERGGRFFALENRCSHMNGDLSKGKQKGFVVKCPRHGAEYDIRTGEVIKNVGWPLLKKAKGQGTFSVSVQDGRLFIEI